MTAELGAYLTGAFPGVIGTIVFAVLWVLADRRIHQLYAEREEHDDPWDLAMAELDKSENGGKSAPPNNYLL